MLIPQLLFDLFGLLLSFNLRLLLLIEIHLCYCLFGNLLLLMLFLVDNLIRLVWRIILNTDWWLLRYLSPWLKRYLKLLSLQFTWSRLRSFILIYRFIFLMNLFSTLLHRLIILLGWFIFSMNWCRSYQLWCILDYGQSLFALLTV